MRVCDRQVWVGFAIIAALVTGVVVGTTFHPGTAEAQASRTLSGGSGIFFNYIKPGATADFEAVMRKVGEALEQSDNPDRKRQAQGWKVYRVKESGPNNSVIYAWFLEPAVSGADYAVSQILNEAFPAEVQALYETYSESFSAGQAIMNLDLLIEF